MNVSIERKLETRKRIQSLISTILQWIALGPLRCQACSSVLTLRRIPSVVLFQFSLMLEKILSSSSSLMFHAPSESLSLPGGTIFSDSACGFPLRSTFLANLLARSSGRYLWACSFLNYFLGRIIGWQSIASRFICSLAVDCQPIVDPESIIESLHHNWTGITRNPAG